MASDDTPILGDKPNEQDEEFCAACDKLKEQFGLECMVIAATPTVPEGATQGKELIYISTHRNPLFLLETTTRLIDFHIARELRNYEESKNKALGMLGFLEKLVEGRMAKKDN